MEELRVQAEKLAEERRIAREQALEWTREAQMESDGERGTEIQAFKQEGRSRERGRGRGRGRGYCYAV